MSPCLCTVAAVSALLLGWVAVGAQPIQVGSDLFPDLASALASPSSSGRTLLIDSPQMVTGDLTAGADTDLVFGDRGRLVRGAGSGPVRVTILGSLTAPLRCVFDGFRPGEVRLSRRAVAEAWPEWWGAVGDGVADDTDAVQSAVGSGAVVVALRSGRYRITRPLDVTNRWEGLTVKGSGMGEAGSVLVGDTGGIVVDATGTRYLHLEDLQIAAGNDRPSTVGILYARSHEVQFVEFNSLERVRVTLPSLPDSNDGNGTVAVYNNAAELWRAYHVYLMADTPMVFTGYNVYGVHSDYVRQFPDYSSMSECSIEGSSTLHAFNGPALLFDNALAIKINNAYLTRSGDSPTRFPYALKFASFWACTVDYSGHIEGFRRFVHSVGNLRDCRLRATIYPESPVIELAGGSMAGCEVDVWPTSEWSTREPHVLLQATGPVSLVANTFHLHHGQGIRMSEGLFEGNLVQAASASPDLQLGDLSRFSYLLLSPDGVRAVNHPEATPNTAGSSERSDYP